MRREMRLTELFLGPNYPSRAEDPEGVSGQMYLGCCLVDFRGTHPQGRHVSMSMPVYASLGLRGGRREKSESVRMAVEHVLVVPMGV